MKVKITKASSPAHWYSDKIGQEFEVEEYDADYHKVKDKKKAIDKSDCEVVAEEHPLITEAKKRYPVGTKFRSALSDEAATVIDNDFRLSRNGNVYVFSGGWMITGDNDKWAEIISLPEEVKEKTKEEQMIDLLKNPLVEELLDKYVDDDGPSISNEWIEWKIDQLQPKPVAIHKSEDGEDLFKGDEVTLVNKADLSIGTEHYFQPHSVNHLFFWFKHRANADEYVLKNKPCGLSYNEIIAMPVVTNWPNDFLNLIKIKSK